MESSAARIVIFINGLPLAVTELKNQLMPMQTFGKLSQLQTYKQQIPSLFYYNEALVISDGVQARIGSLTADKERFMPWRTIDGSELADNTLTQIQVLLQGVFEKSRFLDLIRHFTVFEDVGGGVLVKKMAGYHQYHAVNHALKETIRAATPVESTLAAEPAGFYLGGRAGDRRVGVIWHTQGSGKSLTMAFMPVR